MVLLRKIGARAIYRFDAFDELSPAILEDCFKQDTSSVFLLPEFELSDEYMVLKQRIPSVYTAKVVYSIRKQHLALSKNDVVCHVRCEKPADTSSARKFYVDTQEEFLYKPWAEFLSVARLESTKKFADDNVFAKNSMKFMMDDRCVGFVSVVDWKDWFDNPVHLIAWIWFDAHLSREDRDCAHACALRTMAEMSADVIHSVVGSFNSRSMAFFRKTGFKPACVVISKNS